MTLTEARERRRMTQVSLAHKAKITQATLSRYETGQRPISDKMRIRLAKALRMRYETVWGVTEGNGQ